MDEPKGNATRDEWAAFASSKGAPQEETQTVEDGGLGRDALREKYGTDAPTSGKVVHYIGKADERHITKPSWESIGVNDQEDVVWHQANRFRVATKDLSKTALEYFGRDGDFVIEDA